ncbi:YggT family protein [Ligilactobacillus sp. WILCCON 0076]|uniref:YggT family protein n=1 Tax=Ligilactobacillus ubinensis TaxID=2876789 RepID=A0A9X2FKL2_9LACO|nr:YggT family protein [Ligilactobacillus ubinensis]MCP0886491.1 YggT family protein [Ligilactobacillus ubinensis]
MFSTIIYYLFYLYYVALVVYILMSWFPGAYQTSVGRFLMRICEPYLEIFRFIPPVMGIDFSPIIAFFALTFIEKGLFYFISLVF